MSELDITRSRLLSIWWLIIWRGSLGGALLGALGGAVVGIVGFMLGHRGPLPILAGLAGGVLSLAWSYLVVRMATKNTTADFALLLSRRIPNNN